MLGLLRVARRSPVPAAGTTGPGLIVEAAAGTTRHAVVTITRVR
jgi:hypothetical protein